MEETQIEASSPSSSESPVSEQAISDTVTEAVEASSKAAKAKPAVEDIDAVIKALADQDEVLKAMKTQISDMVTQNAALRKGIKQLVLDFKRVLSINESACRLLFDVFEQFARAGKPILFAHVVSLPLLRRYFKIKLGKRFDTLYRAFDDSDLALEWCEDRVLDEALPTRASRVARPKDYELFAGFTRAELGVITKRLKRQLFRAGEVIICGGEQAREVFFLSRGTVSVFTPEPEDERKRLATFSGGMVFGEMAAIDRAPRSAMIVADTVVECDVLTLEDLDALDESHPAIKIKLLK